MASTCGQVETLLPAYEDGDLAADEQRRLERHLGTCPRCRAVLDGLREGWARLGEWEEVEPSPSYRVHFWRAVGRDEERRRWGWLWGIADRRSAPASFAALLVFGFLAGVLLGWRPSGLAAPAPRQVAVAIDLAGHGPLDGLPEPPGLSPSAGPEAGLDGLGQRRGHLSGEILNEALALAVPLR